MTPPPPPRPVESYIHGLDGPVCLITGPEALSLLGYCGLDAYLRAHRGEDRHLDTAGAKLRLLSAAHRSATGTGPGTSPAAAPEPARASGGRCTTRQVADLAGVTIRGVVKAIGEDRLPARWCGGRWLVDRHDAQDWAARRQER